MIVHLLRAPDYAPDDYFAVCNLLINLDMPGWKFVIPEIEIDPDDVSPNWGNGRRRPEDVHFSYRSPVEKMMYNPRMDAPLSWRELFAVCQFYRDEHRVAPTSIVVLLTRRPNALNWFSAFDKQQNVFVHTADWEKFIPGDSKYPVAYEVLANGLQLQMDLDLDGKEACLHEQAIGCMNDFCVDKTQIAYKLRTGDICAACLERLKTAEVPDVVVEGALAGFDHLRKQMLFRQGFGRKPGAILVNRYHQIVFPAHGNLEAKMPTMARAVYLFFLRHPEGIRLADLIDHRTELLNIYESISGRGSQQAMQASIDRLTNRLETALNENLSRIRRSLVDTLGETLAAPYLIRGQAGEIYRIPLEADLIRFETN